MATTAEIADSLRAAAKKLEAIFVANSWERKRPMSVSIGWNWPPYPFDTLLQDTERVADRIRDVDAETLNNKAFNAFISALPGQLNSLEFGNTGSDPDAVVAGFANLVTMIERQIPAKVQPKPKVDWEDIKDSSALPRDLRRRLTGVAKRIDELEPTVADLQKIIDEIKAAHDAANELPTDMEELQINRERARVASEEATKSSASARLSEGQAATVVQLLGDMEKEGSELLNKIADAQRVSTSAGLAGAFQDRASRLATTGWVWVGALVFALAAALGVGFERVHALKDVLGGDKPASVVWVNALLAILGIGAPVWLAWLSTRQIGQAFRLGEDYEYKASVAKAYEGYRREAVSLDSALATRLFSSALTRLEEAPIRLIEADRQHNTPLQDLLASPQVQSLFAQLPELKTKLLELLPTKSDAVKLVAVPSAAIAEALSAKPESEPNAN